MPPVNNDPLLVQLLVQATASGPLFNIHCIATELLVALTVTIEHFSLVTTQFRAPVFTTLMTDSYF